MECGVEITVGLEPEDAEVGVAADVPDEPRADELAVGLRCDRQDRESVVEEELGESVAGEGVVRRAIGSETEDAGVVVVGSLK